MKSKYIMIAYIIVFSLIFFLIWNFTVGSSTQICTPKMVCDFKYPEARRDETVVDDFHGTKVISNIHQPKNIIFIWRNVNNNDLNKSTGN